MKNHTRIITAALIALIGCAPQVYYSSQEWQRNECNNLEDKNDRAGCLSQAAVSYEKYLQQRQTAPR